MDIVLWILFGGLAGWIASMIMGANAHMGVVTNVIVGVLGAALGGFLASFLGIGAMSGFNLVSLVTAIVGAVILLGIIQAFTGASQTHGHGHTM